MACGRAVRLLCSNYFTELVATQKRLRKAQCSLPPEAIKICMDGEKIGQTLLC
jgi:hypothetical protein